MKLCMKPGKLFVLIYSPCLVKLVLVQLCIVCVVIHTCENGLTAPDGFDRIQGKSIVRSTCITMQHHTCLEVHSSDNIKVDMMI